MSGRGREKKRLPTIAKARSKESERERLCMTILTPQAGKAKNKK
jgi:hypothetical protein